MTDVANTQPGLDAASRAADEAALRELLAWASGFVGPCTVLGGDVRVTGRSTVLTLRAGAERVFVKTHVDRANFENEAFATAQWAPAFGPRAPRLLAIHEAEPLALLLSAVPGVTMEDAALSPQQQRAAWREAGRALAALHALPPGRFFGPCRLDGSPASASPCTDAVAYVLADLDAWTGGPRATLFSADEWRVIEAARAQVGCYTGEPPIACHRDYDPYNWLVDLEHDGAWTGVIDFEFARWDVRVAEFSRYPDWEWQTRPDLLEALFEGYGRGLTPREEQQLLVAHVQYAAAAVSWGIEHGFTGFASEGHRALAWLQERLQ